MLVDTGADVSLVPLSAIRAIGVEIDPSPQYELLGFNDEKSLATAVYLELLFEGRIFRGKFLLIDQPIGILGRNILNSLAILLDAPRGEWTRL